MSDQIEFNHACSRYSDDYDPEHFTPCNCPVCGKWISGNIFQDPLICKSCGSELIAIEASEKLKESDEWTGEAGRICVVTERHKNKEQTKQERQTNRLVKEGHNKWKGFL